MASFDVITDSTSDLTFDIRQQYTIDYLKIDFTDGNKDYAASLDWDQIGAHEFYESMRKGVRYKTYHVTEKKYDSLFRSHLSAGKDILFLSCSSALTNSVKTSYGVRDQLKKEFPDRKIICIDSLNSGMSLGTMAIDVAKMRDQGKSIEECEEWIENNKLFYNSCITVDTLTYLKDAGRVTGSSAFFGNLFAVKPILISDIKGQNLAVTKAKGRRSSISAMADRVAEYIVEPDKQTIWIGHADCFFDADELEMELRKKIPKADIKKYVMGAIVGLSAGPGTLVVNYKGRSKSEQM